MTAQSLAAPGAASSSSVQRIFRPQFGYCHVVPGKFCNSAENELFRDVLFRTWARPAPEGQRYCVSDLSLRAGGFGG